MEINSHFWDQFTFFFLQLGISVQPDSSSEVSLSQMMLTFRNSELDEDNLTLVFNSVYWNNIRYSNHNWKNWILKIPWKHVLDNKYFLLECNIARAPSGTIWQDKFLSDFCSSFYTHSGMFYLAIYLLKNT